MRPIVQSSDTLGPLNCIYHPHNRSTRSKPSEINRKTIFVFGNVFWSVAHSPLAIVHSNLIDFIFPLLWPMSTICRPIIFFRQFCCHFNTKQWHMKRWRIILLFSWMASKCQWYYRSVCLYRSQRMCDSHSHVCTWSAPKMIFGSLLIIHRSDSSLPSAATFLPFFSPERCKQCRTH